MTTIPNNGTYQIYLVEDKINGTLTRLGLMDRISKYGNMSHCTFHSELRLICLCKKGVKSAWEPLDMEDFFGPYEEEMESILYPNSQETAVENDAEYYSDFEHASVEDQSLLIK